jgi:hypothetical protein
MPKSLPFFAEALSEVEGVVEGVGFHGRVPPGIFGLMATIRATDLRLFCAMLDTTAEVR